MLIQNSDCLQRACHVLLIPTEFTPMTREATDLMSDQFICNIVCAQVK